MLRKYNYIVCVRVVPALLVSAYVMRKGYVQEVVYCMFRSTRGSGLRLCQYIGRLVHSSILPTVGTIRYVTICYLQTRERAEWERALRRQLAAAPGGSKLQCGMERCRRRTVTSRPMEKMVAEWLRHMGQNHLGEKI